MILFEDNHCLALAKPAGLLTQAPAGIPSLELWAKLHIKTRYGKSGNVYLGVPHRLDRPVSGVVVFARNSKAARRLAEQFRNRAVTKVYWAIVEGAPTETRGLWEDWLRKVPNEARVEVVSKDAPGAQHAVCEFRVLQVLDGRTLIELRPQTGRSHQLRVQVANRGWPICGDRLYGSRSNFGPAAENPRHQIIALHARALTFLHPIRYEPITVEAELPPAWRDAGVDWPRSTF